MSFDWDNFLDDNADDAPPYGGVSSNRADGGTAVAAMTDTKQKNKSVDPLLLHLERLHDERQRASKSSKGGKRFVVTSTEEIRPNTAPAVLFPATQPSWSRAASA